MWPFRVIPMRSAICLQKLKQNTSSAYFTTFIGKCRINRSMQHSSQSHKLLIQNKLLNYHYISLTQPHCCMYTSPVHFNTTETADNSRDGSMNVQTLLETWFYEVCPRGNLSATMPFKTYIKSLKQPGLNKVIIQLHYDIDSNSDHKVPESIQLSQISNMYELKVSFDEDKANMNVSCEVTNGVVLPVVCIIQVPLQFDLNLKLLEEKDVHVEGMESNKIVVEAEKGNCCFNNVKCMSLSAMSRSGNITCGSTLHGNSYFQTRKSGSISTEKLQGSNIICETEMGSVSVKSLYADNATFRSDAGSINLGHCHGQLYLLAGQSDVNIGSLDGDLDIGLQSGNVSVHLSRHQKANIEVGTGDISVSFPDTASTDLNLDCNAVTVDNRIDVHFTDSELPHHKEGYIGIKGMSLVNVRTLSGTVNLQSRDWIETTNLFMHKFKDL
ncbi:protein FAM185A [Biomphalaria glabrata]|nr:protein FAM185A [Biomphalaria glabrata]